MATRVCSALTAVIISYLIAGQFVIAQPVSYPSEFDARPPLYGAALGPYARSISSASESAQAYFNQGVQMMYAFTKIDAARSFREAQRLDSTCAMCYWGEAWAWGPYLNGKMGDDEAPRAFAAVEKAMEYKNAYADPVEQALITAMSVRYVDDIESVDRADLDTLYSDAMAKVARRFPDDLDVATLYAESLFLLEPRRGSRDVEDPDVVRLHVTLEAILDKDIEHPGACHLYIHATESTTRPEKAEACAEYLGTSIPGASHINHMPSHTWNRVGRWGDSVTSNIRAWHSDLKAEYDEGFAIYPSHNLHMLLFAASMDGQGAVAIQAGNDYAKLTGNPMYHILTLIRFGRFDDLGEIKTRPEDSIPAGVWDFGQGYAAIRAGERDFATAYLRRLHLAANTSSSQFRGHPAGRLLGILEGILAGELARADGDLDSAIRELQNAVATEDSLTYDEPEPLNFSARDWLGSAYLDAGQTSDAIDVFRAALVDHPNNGWALLGLHQAYTASGEEREAEDALRLFTDAWKRSDTWIRGPIF